MEPALNDWVQTMSVEQIYWAVSAVGFVLSLLILWFISRRLTRSGFGRYKWILYGFLLIYAGFETIPLIFRGESLLQNAFFWFWGLLSAISLWLLWREVKGWAKNRST